MYHMLSEVAVEPEGDTDIVLPYTRLTDVENHTEWRRFMAERIAMEMDMDAFGVRDAYLIGSAESGRAGIGSDIDLVLHVDDGDPEKLERLDLWLDGWSKALALLNYLRTGYLTTDLLDIHLVTDKSMAENDSYAIQIKDPAGAYRLVCGC